MLAATSLLEQGLLQRKCAGVKTYHNCTGVGQTPLISCMREGRDVLCRSGMQRTVDPERNMWVSLTQTLCPWFILFDGPMLQVGACIVGVDHIILGIGYNGFPRGCPDGKLPWAKVKLPYTHLMLLWVGRGGGGSG